MASQNGAFVDNLQPHIYILLTFSSRENLIGLNLVPLNETPSQNGCVFDKPLLSQK